MADGRIDIPFDVKTTANSVDVSQIENAIKSALSDTSKFESGLRTSINDAFKSINIKSGWSNGFFNIDKSSIQEVLGTIIVSGDKAGRTLIDMDTAVQQLSNDITKVVATMADLAQTEGGIDSEEFKSAEQALHEYLAQLQEVLATQERFTLDNIAGTTDNQPETVSVEQPITENLDQSVERIIELETELDGTVLKVNAVQNAFYAVKDALHLTRQAAQDMAQTTASGVDDAAQRAERLRGLFGLWNGTFLGVKSNTLELANGVHNVIGAVQKMGTVVGSAFSKIGGAIKGGISKIAQFGKQAAKSADQAGNKMKRMTLQMVKAMLGVRGLYMLFRKMKSAITEAFQAMAQQVPEIGKQFSEFKTALNQIKGSIGTAFQPILSYVIPVLTRLLGIVNAVIEAIAKFNAVLTGQNKIYKYTAAEQDYAKAVSGSGSAAKKAKADLMGFDEINRLSAPDEGGGGGGSGGMGTYELADVDPNSAISDFANKVKEAWKNNDFTEIGTTIGEALVEGLGKATKFFQTEGMKWAGNLSKDITTFINGLVDVDGLGKSFGTSIGSALNVGIHFLSDFWNNTNWGGIGTQIGGAINGLFDTVNWEELGTIFSGKFNALFSALGGLATTTDWSTIGTDLATTLNTIITNIDLSGAISSVSSSILGLLEGAVAFIKTTDFSAIGSKIADGFANIDWVNTLSTAGTLISKGAQGILDMLIAFLEKTDWNKATKDIIKGIEKMFENVWDNGELINKLARGFGELLGAAFIACFNIGGWISENIVMPLADKLSDEMLNAQEKYSSLPGPLAIGLSIVDGLLNGIIHGLLDIGRWIADNIVLPIVDGIKELFGIHSPSTVMMEIGGFLIDGLFEGLKNIWESIKSIFEGLKNSIVGVFESIKSAILGVWESVKSTTSEIWGGIKSTIVDIAQRIKSIVTGIFNGLKDGVLGAFKMIREAGGLIWDGLWNIIKGVINTIIGGINGMIWAVESAINFVIDCMNKLSWDVPDWVPLIGGETFGFDISNVHFDRIPELAQGAVLPPNNPFLALVGDQKSGTNVEAPLDTIKQAVAEVLNEQLDGMMAGFEAVVQAINNKDTTAMISYKEVGQAVDVYHNKRNTQMGY